MSFDKFSFKHFYLISFLLLIIFAICDLVLFAVTKSKEKEYFVIEQIGEYSVPTTDIYFMSSKYHGCKAKDSTNDAFFECKIINNSSRDITNWKVDVYLEGDAKLITCWNGNATLNNRILTTVSNSKSTDIIRANSTYSFDIYVNYKEHTSASKIITSGTEIYRLTDYTIHKVILVASFMIIAALIAAVILSSAMKREIDVLNRLTKRSYAIIDQTMKTFVNFIDAKDEYTKGHSTRVAEYSRLITKRMGFDEQFQQDMYYMGLMHDIGKITVPDNILNKTGHLTTEEWSVIQMHTENGARLLQNFTIMPEIKDAVLYHHERYDGKGYLNHLKGEEIPLCARIICVADSYDAMSTTRCYRLKYSRERIIQELERCAGKQFDPAIAKIMIDLLKDGTI